MKYFLFPLLALMFCACGHHKLRFSKVNRKQKVVEISAIASMEKKIETVSIAEVPIEQEVTKESTPNETAVPETDKSLESNKNIRSQVPQKIPPTTDQDSVTVKKVDAEYMTQEAVRAEKLGTWSLITGIAVPALFLLAFVSLFTLVIGPFNPLAAIISVVLGISILVSLVLSYVFGIASLRAPYNTPVGRKRAITGISITSAFLLLYLLIILFGLF